MMTARCRTFAALCALVMSACTGGCCVRYCDGPRWHGGCGDGGLIVAGAIAGALIAHEIASGCGRGCR
jgi:hypothetical protein